MFRQLIFIAGPGKLQGNRAFSHVQLQLRSVMGYNLAYGSHLSVLWRNPSTSPSKYQLTRRKTEQDV